jgi:hypothetical protein
MNFAQIFRSWKLLVAWICVFSWSCVEGFQSWGCVSSYASASQRLC